MRKTMIGIVKP